MVGKVVAAAAQNAAIPTIINPSAMSETFHARGALDGFIIPASAATNFTSAIRGHAFRESGSYSG